MAKKGIALILTALQFSGCALFARQSAQEETHPQCYWMENVTGKYEWVATQVVLGGPYSLQQCYAADSCDGGQGASGGGCYKWAYSAQSERLPWPQPDPKHMQTQPSVKPVDQETISITEKELLAQAQDPKALKAGQVIYDKHCSACHAPAGKGSIGSNLTDNYWLYIDGKPFSQFQITQKGLPSKGMPGWESLLSKQELAQVVSYVMSLKGSAPKDGKAPQGKKYE